MTNRKVLITAIAVNALALGALLIYSIERTAWLFDLFEDWTLAARAAAVVVELAAVALLVGAGALAHLDAQARAWANRALVAVLSVQALANLSAGYLRGGRETQALFAGENWLASYAVAATLWFAVNLAVPGLILCLSKLLERLIAAWQTNVDLPLRMQVQVLRTEAAQGEQIIEQFRTKTEQQDRTIERLQAKIKQDAERQQFEIERASNEETGARVQAERLRSIVESTEGERERLTNEVQQLREQIETHLAQIEDLELAADPRQRPGGFSWREGFVYLLKGEGDLYKIGIAKDVDKRIRAIAGMVPFAVQLVHQIKAAAVVDLETQLHRCYEAAGKQVSGEWFALSDDDLAALCSVDAIATTEAFDRFLDLVIKAAAQATQRPLQVSTDKRTRAQQLQAEGQSYRQIAAGLNVSVSTVHAWLKRANDAERDAERPERQNGHLREEASA